MYRVMKVLNNNAILCYNEEEEIIVLHKGIGFAKKNDDVVEIPTQAKKYLMQKAYKSKHETDDIINSIDPVYLEIASEIIHLTALKFGKVDNDILLPLADHIYFALKRMEKNINPMNPFVNDIKLLFPEEYSVALQGKEIIKSFLSKEINEDEVCFISLHIHSAISSNKVMDSMQVTCAIHESILELEKNLNIKINVDSISYARLMNHIKYLIIRLNQNEKLQMNISDFVEQRFPFAYEYAKNICQLLAKTLKRELPENEIGYLALHLERILNDSFK